MTIDKELLEWAVNEAIFRQYGNTTEPSLSVEIYKEVERAKLDYENSPKRVIMPSFDMNAPKPDKKTSEINLLAQIANMLYEEEMYWRKIGEDMI